METLDVSVLHGPSVSVMEVAGCDRVVRLTMYVMQMLFVLVYWK